MDPRNNSFNHNRGKRRPQTYSNGSNKKLKTNYLKSTIERPTLPILDYKTSLLNEINKYPSLIMIGETGSGKTTQLPQFLHEMDRDQVIGITQPRRISAITISIRVGQEMGSKIGDIVGYKVRFEDTTTSKTKIKYLTDGMLLRESMQDSLLSYYNVIILDEAHERTVNTDILFGIVKQAQKKRKEKGIRPLKIIIMSATLDPDLFKNYFECESVFVEGRQHPVSVYHSNKPQGDYFFSSLVMIFQIHREAPPNHDILIFLTGQEEIEAMIQKIKRVYADLKENNIRLIPYPLYGSMNPNTQLNAFRKTPPGCRKVILSTNIAETSVTIPGIKYVIDTGMVKVRKHIPGLGIDVLKVQRISQAQALQRTGRAGRESAGICYRLYTEDEFNQMPSNPTPEIRRSCLSGVILQMLALRINPKTFDFIDRPSEFAILEALEELKYLGAIESLENLNLTDIGKKMAQFPIEPRFSKMILIANELECLNAILTIVALISSENIFVSPQTKKEQALEKRKKFSSTLGDHMTLYNVWKCFKKEFNSSNINEWCYSNFLNRKNLEHAYKVRNQLKEICRKCNINYQSNTENDTNIRKCLLHGMPFNVAYLQKDKKYTTVITRQTVYIHPSSVLFNTHPEMILFNDLEDTSRLYVKQLSVIEPEWFNEVKTNLNGGARLKRY